LAPQGPVMCTERYRQAKILSLSEAKIVIFLSPYRVAVKLPAHRAGLPGNVRTITGSAFLPAYKAGHPADLPVKCLVQSASPDWTRTDLPLWQFSVTSVSVVNQIQFFGLSFFFNKSFRSLGFAFPFVAFITSPTKYPKSFSFPLR
jgi:hypothetical protein